MNRKGRVVMEEEKKYREDIPNNIRRGIFVAIAFILQIAWFTITLLKLRNTYIWVSIPLNIVTTVSVLGIFGRHTNPTIKTSWIYFIMAVPILGWVFYLLSYKSNFVNTMTKRFAKIDKELFKKLPENEEILEELREENIGVGNQLYFLKKSAGFPLYKNTDVKFYSEASLGIEAQKEELRKAEKFIFMEYHAIEDRESFGQIKEILAERAAAGVEVRVFYDEMGSLGFINNRFIKEMEELGIQCRAFNPITPVLNFFMNNRDHRKITVIDGKIGFTGGYNLADEYFNLTHPYGYWKDTGVRIQGDGVRTLTMLFLEMWNVMNKGDMEDVSKYLPELSEKDKEDYFPEESKGIIVPYADTPLDELHTAEDVYMNILKNAKHYAYIMTPYLILTDDMIRELTLAARRGVDVRIITPGIPDKPLIYKMTRSYYNQLARDGVKIYEYTPGFCHAKQVVCDDEVAVVGTINFDYRSLYHHFENGVYLYNYECIKDIRKDFENSFSESAEVTDYYNTGRSTALRIGQCVMRIFAPLM